ncbi:MAG: carboxypeptidase regulatory-like domain-containing protein [Planctomycetaceae bacterium]|nr:carboxypeptidase regulatory-like domain-containing protein [Planctomycetaceae bacterium]
MRFTILTVILLASLGCGGGASDVPELTPATGTVTLDGAPLADASITFELQDAGEGKKSSWGKTDASGKYEMQFGAHKGVRPGKHKVSISKITGDSEDPEKRGDIKESIPDRYNSSTTLTVDVTDGGGPYDLQLQSK